MNGARRDDKEPAGHAESGVVPAKSTPEASEASTPRDPLVDNPYRGKIGAFEGARYEAEGLYRPALDCVMFSRRGSQFCGVCCRAIERAIDLKSATSKTAPSNDRREVTEFRTVRGYSAARSRSGFA